MDLGGYLPERAVHWTPPTWRAAGGWEVIDVVDVSDSRNLVARSVAELLQRRGGLTRAELVCLTGLPKSTITECVRAMLVQQVLREQDIPIAPGARGRPARMLYLIQEDVPLIVVVLTHAERLAQGDVRVAITGTADTPVWSATAPSEGQPLAAATALTRHGLAQLGLSPTDIQQLLLVVPLPISRRASSASMDSDLRVVHSHADIIGAAPHLTLSAALGIPALLANDADMAALGEFRHGAGRNHPDMIFIKAVNGLGMGIISHGALVEPTTRPTGELVYLRQPADRGTCFCGNAGCWFADITTVPISLPAIVHRSVTAVVTLADLERACRDGDSGVHAALYAVGMHIGAAVEQFCMVSGEPLILMERDLGAAFSPVSLGMTSILRTAAPALALPPPQITLGTLGPVAEISGAIEFARRSRIAVR